MTLFCQVADKVCNKCGTDKVSCPRNDRPGVRWYCKPCMRRYSVVRRDINRGDAPPAALKALGEVKPGSYPMPVLDSMPIEQLFNRIADLLIGNPGQHKVIACKECGKPSRMVRCVVCHWRHRSLLAVKNGNARRSAVRRIDLGAA